MDLWRKVIKLDGEQELYLTMREREEGSLKDCFSKAYKEHSMGIWWRHHRWHIVEHSFHLVGVYGWVVYDLFRLESDILHNDTEPLIDRNFLFATSSAIELLDRILYASWDLLLEQERLGPATLKQPVLQPCLQAVVSSNTSVGRNPQERYYQMMIVDWICWIGRLVLRKKLNTLNTIGFGQIPLKNRQRAR